jgi:hypothetical protein
MDIKGDDVDDEAFLLALDIAVPWELKRMQSILEFQREVFAECCECFVVDNAARLRASVTSKHCEASKAIEDWKSGTLA